MTGLFKRPSALERKIKRVRKELALVDSELRTLTKFVEKPGMSADLAQLKATPKEEALSTRFQSPPSTHSEGLQSASQPRQRITQHQKEPERSKDDRFADYLASSFQTVQLLRRERSKQRTKAIVMLIFVLFALYALYHFFF